MINFGYPTYNSSIRKLEYVRRISNRLNIGVEITYRGYKNEDIIRNEKE